MDTNKKPILALTMGDPAGIGPEIIIKSLALKRPIINVILLLLVTRQ